MKWGMSGGDPPHPYRRALAAATQHPQGASGLQVTPGDLNQSALITVINDQTDFLSQDQKEMHPNEESRTAWIWDHGREPGDCTTDQVPSCFFSIHSLPGNEVHAGEL